MPTPIQNPYTSPDTGDESLHSSMGSTLSQHVRTGMILTFALVQGIVIMAVILSLVADFDSEVNQTFMDFDIANLLVGAGVAVMLIAAGGAALWASLSRQRAIERFRSSNAPIDLPLGKDQALPPAVARLVGASSSWTIVGQALLEGAATINLILMLIDHNPLHLAIAAFCVVGIVIATPTYGKKCKLIENAVQ